jgi:hypothetical protein
LGEVRIRGGVAASHKENIFPNKRVVQPVFQPAEPPPASLPLPLQSFVGGSAEDNAYPG